MSFTALFHNSFYKSCSMSLIRGSRSRLTEDNTSSSSLRNVITHLASPAVNERRTKSTVLESRYRYVCHVFRFVTFIVPVRTLRFLIRSFVSHFRHQQMLSCRGREVADVSTTAENFRPWPLSNNRSFPSQTLLCRKF